MSDLSDGHRLAFDLMAYGSTKFPAFDGTLSNLSAYVLNKLSNFALRARRVLEFEISDEKERQKLLLAEPRFELEGSPHVWTPHPVIHASNGLIHGKEIWINHIYDREAPASEPSGSIVMLGFGTETDKHRLDHIDLFGLALGFLRRPGAPSLAFPNGPHQ